MSRYYRVNNYQNTLWQALLNQVTYNRPDMFFNAVEHDKDIHAYDRHIYDELKKCHKTDTKNH